jgi:hypothetical protein
MSFRTDDESSTVSRSICLGSAFLTGDEVTVTLGMTALEDCTQGYDWIAHVQTLALREANAEECAETVGIEGAQTFVDANATGWTIEEGSENDVPAHAVVLDGSGNYYKVEAGEGTQGGVRFSYTTEIPTPAAGKGIALLLDTVTDAPAETGYRLGRDEGPRFEGGRIIDHPTLTSEVLCVPPWAYGTIQPLTYAVAQPIRFNGSVGRRAVVEVHRIDLVEDTRCAPPGVLGGDFESDGVGWWPWVHPSNLDLPVYVIKTESEPTNSYLHMEPHKVCSSVGAAQNIEVPAAGGQVRFRYRSNGGAATVVGHKDAGVEYWIDLDPSETWKTATQCLPAPSWANTLDVGFYLGTGGSCADTSDKYLDIDDVEFFVDGACTPPVYDD